MTTQRELAVRLGLSQAAVSMALRGGGRVAAATRRRVLEAAGAWRPDPAHAALARRRWARPVGAIAYLGARVAGDDPCFDNYWLALRAEARRRGLRLHHIDHRLRGEAVRLARELARLGITGLLVGQDNRGLPPWQVDWPAHPVVHCGLYAAPGPGDVVCADLLAAPAAALAAMAVAGPVAALMTVSPRSLAERMLHAALSELDARGALVLHDGGDLTAAARLLARRPPAAVLGYGDEMGERLRRLGVDLPYAALACGEHRGQRGLAVPFRAIAARALDVVVAKCAAGECGAGHERRMHLLPLVWQDGAA